ncbi:MAG: DUF3304 domain-containing protein [Polaromonas sp.]|nr:DUF3304 domain-containing protein [Polaromonas sp.]
MYRQLWVCFIGSIALLNACTHVQKPDPYLENIRINKPQTWERWMREDAIRKSQATAVLRVSMSCIEHGTVTVGSWHVQEVAHGQITQGEVGGRFSCGGSLALGYPVPLKWKPGLKVKVRWSTYAPGATEPVWHEKYTSILPYAEPGSVYVHFFDGDEVRIAVANNGATSPFHPIPRDSVVAPAEIK